MLDLVEEGNTRWLEVMSVARLQLVASHSCRNNGVSKPFVWTSEVPSHGSFVLLVVDASYKKIRKTRGNKWGATIAWKGERQLDSHIQGWKRVCATCPLQAECLAIFEALKGAFY